MNDTRQKAERKTVVSIATGRTHSVLSSKITNDEDGRCLIECIYRLETPITKAGTVRAAHNSLGRIAKASDVVSMKRNPHSVHFSRDLFADAKLEVANEVEALRERIMLLKAQIGSARISIAELLIDQEVKG